MSGLSGETQWLTSVGGVNLTVANVAVGGSFTASTPSAGLTVSENATVGTRVGQVIATDVNISRDIVADGYSARGPIRCLRRLFCWSVIRKLNGSSW